VSPEGTKVQVLDATAIFLVLASGRFKVMPRVLLFLVAPDQTSLNAQRLLGCIVIREKVPSH